MQLGCSGRGAALGDPHTCAGNEAMSLLQTAWTPPAPVSLRAGLAVPCAVVTSVSHLGLFSTHWLWGAEEGPHGSLQVASATVSPGPVPIQSPIPVPPSGPHAAGPLAKLCVSQEAASTWGWAPRYGCTPMSLPALGC